MSSLSHNPYVGPRTFTRYDGERFFGREREARDLLSLVISERLVLFYAQSGAGKSSLINARLVPQLEQAGFAVSPPGRVSGGPPPEIERVENIFIFNLLLSLQHDTDHLDRFARMSLSEFLARLTSPDGQRYYCAAGPQGRPPTDDTYQEMPYVLIIDQFEEIFTAHPARWPERDAFFRQLNAAMEEDPLLWVLLIMREDYVATLDPYAPLLTEGVRARFHMERLDYERALQAIKKPAAQQGRPFEPGVAETLADNLRQIRVHGRTTPQLGQFIEPVQLQVVCYQLWESLGSQPSGPISQADLPLDYIDHCLIQFYENGLRQVARATSETELSLRQWFQEELITETGTRGTVYRGPTHSGRLTNEAAELLVKHFLLRSEMRAGGVWYELTHDRFIDPILKSNAERHIGRLKRQSGISTGLMTLMMTLLIVGLISKFWQERKAH